MELLKQRPPSLLGVSPATDQSEAFVRTATVTKVTAEVVPRTRTVWRGPRPRCSAKVHEAMTKVGEGDEHQMERRLLREANA